MHDQINHDASDSVSASGKGALYIVATPIGNLDDMSIRAVKVLQNVELIVVEDKRQSVKLLQHFNIQAPTYTLHDHNERENSQKLVKKLQDGAQIALISDAGTPLISDPGYLLVNAAIEHGVDVVPVPGASALICALSASGLPTDRFCFEGFLPAKSAARVQRLEQLSQETRTLIFYEAPHRITATLADLVSVFGPERPAVMARELTKTFETIARKPLHTLQQWVESDPNQQKGEIVLLVGGNTQSGKPAHDYDHLLMVLLEVLPLKQAVSVAAQLSDGKKNALYERALKLKGRA